MSLTVGLISLGCPKNLIDSEIMIGHLQKAGMTMTPDAELADVMVVNTCAFIDQAKQEAIDAILDVVRARESGTYPENQKLIVAGCLSQRFHKELPALLPEVDAFIGRRYFHEEVYQLHLQQSQRPRPSRPPCCP